MVDRRPARPLTVHRFFVRPESLETSPFRFSPEASHQIRHVLRLQTGERVIVLDGTGWEYIVCLDSSGKEVVGTLEERRQNEAEPRLLLTVYQGLVRASRLEVVLQKCTEIGVAGFVPLQTERCIAREPGADRRRRFAAIVREAAEQSGRGVVPTVDEPLSLIAALDRAAGEGPMFFLWEEERCEALSNYAARGSNRAGVFVGPEGGFTAGEAQAAATAGAHIVSLGPRILRAETAAIAASALLLLTPSAAYPYNRAQLGDIGEPLS